jgi:hypothetical protein
VEKNSVMARLLHSETAADALQTLQSEMEKSADWYRIEAIRTRRNVSLIVIGAIAVAVATWLITYFIMRKKVKNATRLGANGENPALADGVPTDNSPAYTPSAGDSDGDGKTNAPADAPAAGDPPSAS